MTLNEEGSQVRFTLPELEEGEDWRVQISGRYVAADQVSMSVHLDTPGVWEPGRSYEIPIEPRLRQAEGEGYYTQLTLHISLVRGEDSWDGRRSLLALASQPQGAGSGWLWPVEGYHTLSALFGGRVHPVTGQRTDIPASTSRLRRGRRCWPPPPARWKRRAGTGRADWVTG